MEQLCKLVQYGLGVLVGLEDKSIFIGPQHATLILGDVATLSGWPVPNININFLFIAICK
jgi:hypothetical protein